MKIKILFLLSNFKSGGAETQYGNLIKNIDRARFEPVVGLIHYQGNCPSGEFLERFGDVKTIDFVRKGALDVGVIASIASYCKRNDVEIIQSLLFMDNQIAKFAGLLSGVPAITSVRGEIGPLLGKRKTWFEFKTQFLSKKIVVNSFWLKDYLVKNGSRPEKVIAIHNGTDFQRYQCEKSREALREEYGVSAEASVITIVARLHPMKDHMTFLRSIELLIQSGINVVALIVGDGEEREALEGFVSSQGMTDSVIFMGNVAAGVNEIYKLSDLVMLTSQWGESFPNVLLEAISAGVPVIASNISAVGEIITDGENGYLVEKRDAKAFAERAKTLLDNPAIRSRFIENGKETVKRFTVGEMVSKFQNLYLSVVN